MSVRLRAGIRLDVDGREERVRVATRLGQDLAPTLARTQSAAAELTLSVADGEAPEVGVADGMAAIDGVAQVRLIEVRLRALRDVAALGAVLDIPADLDERDLDLFGYQSWSETGTYRPGDSPRSLAAPLRWTPFAALGDLDVARQDRDLGAPASHEQLLAHRTDRAGQAERHATAPGRQEPATWLAASLLGREVFTVWQAMGEVGDRFARGVLDVAGMRLAAGEERVIGRVLVVWADGRVPALAALRAADGVEPRPAERITGWCSWYEYYHRIDEQVLSRALSQMAGAWPTPAVFQIDDGYQRRVGDWLELRDDAFPNGMAPLAAAASTAGFTPGIWVAPFVASGASRLAKEHPDWLARDARGRRVAAGFNQVWGGTFYALDLGNTEVLGYLSHVLATMREEWGYQFFKLDFLYAAALAPPDGMTRAQAMRRAMVLLRAWCGEATMLGCGVPLTSAAGLVEYCRIGADVAGAWESPIQKAAGSRERVSTASALAATIGRAWLDRHYFGNDPDVIILRDWDTKLSRDEVDTLASVNALLGSLVFCSDDLARYDAERWRELRRLWPLPEAQVRSIEVPGAHVLELEESGVRYELAVNLAPSPQRLADGAVLPAHATRVRRMAAPSDPVLGSTGYVLPGGEVERATRRGSRLTLRLRPGFRGPSTVELRPDERIEQVVVAGEPVPFSRDARGRLQVHLP